MAFILVPKAPEAEVSKFSERVQIYKADDGPAVVPGFYSARADIATAGQEPEGQECTKRAGRRLDRFLAGLRGPKLLPILFCGFLILFCIIIV